jgi:hypothetical protein
MRWRWWLATVVAVALVGLGAIVAHDKLATVTRDVRIQGWSGSPDTRTLIVYVCIGKVETVVSSSVKEAPDRVQVVVRARGPKYWNGTAECYRASAPVPLSSPLGHRLVFDTAGNEVRGGAS